MSAVYGARGAPARVWDLTAVAASAPGPSPALCHCPSENPADGPGLPPGLTVVWCSVQLVQLTPVFFKSVPPFRHPCLT